MNSLKLRCRATSALPPRPCRLGRAAVWRELHLHQRARALLRPRTPKPPRLRALRWRKHGRPKGCVRPIESSSYPLQAKQCVAVGSDAVAAPESHRTESNRNCRLKIVVSCRVASAIARCHKSMPSAARRGLHPSALRWARTHRSTGHRAIRHQRSRRCRRKSSRNRCYVARGEDLLKVRDQYIAVGVHVTPATPTAVDPVGSSRHSTVHATAS
eukprot:SAG11_NODE_1334_length_5178_cov_10.938374_4_plen_214_part_00